MPQNSFVYRLVHRLLIRHGHYAGKWKIQKDLFAHPDFPSIKAITDVLDKYAVPNLAATVSLGHLNALPSSFLFIAKTGEVFLLQQTKLKLIITSEKLEAKDITPSELAKLWSGAIVAVEASKKRWDILVNGLKSNFSTVALFLLFPAVLVLQQPTADLPYYVLLLLTLLGGCLSTLAVMETIGRGTTVLNKICGSEENDEACSTVINAAPIKLPFQLSLADLGVLFFGSITCTILVHGIHTTLMLLLTTMALPMVGYSVFVQRFVLKKWCKLCLLISGSVVGLFVGALFFNEGLIFEPQAWLFYGTSTLLVVLAYLKLKKHLVEISKSRANEIAYYRITRNVQVFEALLKASPQFDLTPVPPTIAYEATAKQFTMHCVLDLYCAPCKHAFKSLRELMQETRLEEAVSFSIVCKPSSLEPERSIFVANLLQKIAENEGASQAMEALFEWYELHDFNRWVLRFNRPYVFAHERHRKIGQMLIQLGIHSSPAMLINGRMVPEIYQLSMLPPLLLEQLKH